MSKRRRHRVVSFAAALKTDINVVIRPLEEPKWKEWYMMKRRILASALLMLTLAALFAPSSFAAASKKSKAASTKGMTLLYSSTGSLAPDMPEWSFKLYGKKAKGESYFESFTLTIRDEKGRVVDTDTALSTNGTVNDAHVLLTDVNFDGCPDVLYTEGAVGAHEHYWYNLRLWDAKSKAFRSGEGFSEICNPVADEKDKVIRSCGAGSAYEDIYSIYVYKDDKYRLVKKLVLTYDEVNGQELRTYEVYSFDTGVAKLVSTSRGVGMPNPNNPSEADFWGPKSTWKLDDPIWYQSRHFQGSGE